MTEGEEFDYRQPLTPESLQTYMDLFFPERIVSPEWTERLSKDLNSHNIKLIDILRYYLRLKDILKKIEQEEFDLAIQMKESGHNVVLWKENEEGEPIKGWAQVGIVQVIVDLSDDDYWNYRINEVPMPDYRIDFINKWRKILSERESGQQK